MQLTVFSSDDNTYFLEISQDMPLGDLFALIAAEADADPADLELVYNGQKMTDHGRTLASYGMGSGSEAVQLESKRNRASSSTAREVPGQNGAPGDFESIRLSALGNPALMGQLRAARPELADAVLTNPTRFAQMMRDEMRNRDNLAVEKKRQEDLLNADPYDVEAQRKIEEAIRQERVMENMSHAIEYSPEAFGNVCMLYIDVEVNGHKVKAFVDSGAQSTIISPECAEACGIMRLLDQRFAGMARGVGTAKILGRIHSAQMRLGDLHLPVAFHVLEGRDVDLLFGLDMLKRHQACIDLEKNCLRIQGREVPFLPEHELPAKARRMGEEEVAEELGQAAASGTSPVAGPSTAAGKGKGGFPGAGQALGGASSGSSESGQQASSSSSRPQVTAATFPEADIQAIMNLGESRENAIQVLEAAGGNVDVAASMLFS